MFKLLLMDKCCFCYYCKSTAVLYSFAVQLLFQLPLLVNCCLSYCCMFNSCLNYYRSKYCWRSIYVSVTVPCHHVACVRVTSTGLVPCQLFLRVNPCFCYLSMIKRYPDFCCMQVNSCLIYFCLSTLFLIVFCLSYSCMLTCAPSTVICQLLS
jgi:hypothetical protein